MTLAPTPKAVVGCLGTRPSLLILAAVAVALAPTAGRAQDNNWTPGSYMSQAMGRVMGTVRSIDDTTDYGYDGPGKVCFMGGYFRPGASIGFNRYLERGVRYAFVGGGDDDAVDVDIEVFDENGNLVAEDTDTDASPMVEYTPPRSGVYTIDLELYEAPEACFCSMAVLRRDGIDVPTENVVEVAGNLLGHCLEVAKKVDTAGFNSQENQWAIWGALYEDGQRLTVDNVKLHDGVNVFLAAGDTQTVDIDVHLLTESDQLIIEDVLDDSAPRVVYTAKGMSSNYQVATTNATSKGLTLIMTAAMTVK